MTVKASLANQGKTTHEDRASSTAMSARSKFRDTKPESRPGVRAPGTVGQAEKFVSGLGKG